MSDRPPKEARLEGAAQRARWLAGELEGIANAIESREFAPGKRVPLDVRAGFAEKADDLFARFHGAKQLDVLARRELLEAVRQGGRLSHDPERVLPVFAERFPEYAAQLSTDDLGAVIAAYSRSGGRRSKSAGTTFEEQLGAAFRKIGIGAAGQVMRELLRGYRRRRAKR